MEANTSEVIFLLKHSNGFFLREMKYFLIFHCIGGRKWKLEIALVRNVLRNNTRRGGGREDFSYKASFLKET